MNYTPRVKLNDADYLLNFKQFKNKQYPHLNQDDQISLFEIINEETFADYDPRFKKAFNQIIEYARTKSINNLLVVCHGDMFDSIVRKVTDGKKWHMMLHFVVLLVLKLIKQLNNQN